MTKMHTIGVAASAVLGAMIVSLVPGGTASAAPAGCSDWGPGGFAANDLMSCVSVDGNTVSGNGKIRPGGKSTGAVMWIQVYGLDSGKRHSTQMSNSVCVQGLPAGRYQVDYYRGDGGGVVRSPIVEVKKGAKTGTCKPSTPGDTRSV